MMMQAYKQRLGQAAKLLERSLAIKMANQPEKEDEYSSMALRRRSSIGEAEPSEGEPMYPVECCGELERLGQVYAAAGDLKEAKRTLRLAIASRHREVLAARRAKDAVIPGHARQVWLTDPSAPHCPCASLCMSFKCARKSAGLRLAGELLTLQRAGRSRQQPGACRTLCFSRPRPSASWSARFVVSCLRLLSDVAICGVGRRFPRCSARHLCFERVAAGVAAETASCAHDKSCVAANRRPF